MSKGNKFILQNKEAESRLDAAVAQNEVGATVVENLTQQWLSPKGWVPAFLAVALSVRCEVCQWMQTLSGDVEIKIVLMEMLQMPIGIVVYSALAIYRTGYLRYTGHFCFHIGSPVYREWLPGKSPYGQNRITELKYAIFD